MRRLALEHGAHAAEVNEAFEKGGDGAAALAEAVVDAADHPTAFDYLYPDDAPIADKIEAIAKRAYGADGIFLLHAAENDIHRFTEQGLDELPICMAKTHLSLSHDPELLNAPTGFTVPVRAVRAYTGAGWLVALCGDMQTMPGLSATPAAFNVDIRRGRPHRRPLLQCPSAGDIISTANINRHVIPTAHASDKVELIAVASRDQARAEAYAREWEIERAYGSYEALLEDPDVEAVYISLPNSMHVEWSIRSVEAGKHVLCEKPFDRRPEEVERAFDAADKPDGC